MAELGLTFRTGAQRSVLHTNAAMGRGKKKRLESGASPAGSSTYLADRKLLPRISQCVREHPKGSGVLKYPEDVADFLQSKHRDYARKGKNVFRLSVKKGISVFMREYGSSGGFEDDEDAALARAEDRRLGRRREENAGLGADYGDDSADDDDGSEDDGEGEQDYESSMDDGDDGDMSLDADDLIPVSAKVTFVYRALCVVALEVAAMSARRKDE